MRNFRDDRRNEVIANAKDLVIDYKFPETLKRMMTESGSIIPRSRTGLTAKQQRLATREIKRARQIGLLPFTTMV
ncbi:MAG: 30S ribosomal protein S18 [Microgenomates group bacterium GW2011_GWF2_45_18]|nr:MAG: 30S ribosomal protein S18 [Microgenomates group bacterium GW2011_GWF1_44_10]KKU01819.1 MAG: 30S ribosomal protein S18 [Microgenomates group bacterium GW2011_GWF2_45_18]OGJ41452.1 MAG: 30S ribosomal protein S18 [Candidatus Pacebacteria bacterium RIFOXYB1_FULL_44_10]HAU98877.1 30S ribosomal protein S18 [Candidatus Paceibacterota bacterium]HAX01165.1 30S ribosomal protein S18 [Candidatus Paceibacterota bacterium]